LYWNEITEGHFFAGLGSGDRDTPGGDGGRGGRGGAGGRGGRGAGIPTFGSTDTIAPFITTGEIGIHPPRNVALPA
jgi:hypothetical protein